MITIYDAKAADFSTLGLGALLPTKCTVSEMAGGMYEMKIVHPITDDMRHDRIKPMRIIKAPAPVRETPQVEIGQSGSVSRSIYKVVTDGRRLYLRVKPDQESKGLHAYKPGTEVATVELSADGKWRRVIILDGGATGWMWAGNLEYVRTETEIITGDAPGTIIRPRQTREQLFRVYFYSPDTKTRTVTAEARHITYDLVGAIVDGEYSPENVPADQVCAQIMAKADHDISDFHIYCTITDPISGDYGGRNILDCLLDPETGVVAQTKARVIRDNYDIFILPDEARNRGVELRYGKNLLAAHMEADTSDTITRIKPVGKDKNGEKLYIAENGGWVESPYINDYPVIHSKEVEYDVVESDNLPINQARALLKDKAEADFAAGCDMASVKLDADFVRLELTEDYKHLANAYALHLYDSVPVIDREADIVATARMTQYVYDAILDEYSDTGLGELNEVKSTIYGYEIAQGTVSGGKLIPNTVNGDRLQNLSVSYGKFDLAAINQLSANAITAIRADIRELVAGNITTDQLYADLAVIAAAQITAANIEKANIQWAEIENLAVEIAKVVNAEIKHAKIDWAQIENAEIDAADIKNLSASIATIVKAEIALAEIDWAQIKNAEIDTAQIKLGAITQALIAAGAIGTAQIADGSITEAKVVSLNADVIKTGTLSVERLLLKGANGLFYAINATAGGLTSTQLTQEQYKNAISGTALVARSVTADKIAAKSITANEILSGTITAAEINVANLFAAQATIAALDAYIIRVSTIEALKGSLNIWATDKINLAVGNIQIGGRNLLRNTGDLVIGNYAFDASGATAQGTVSYGDEGLKIVCLNQNVRWWLGSVKVTPGQSYAMSVRYRIESGTSPIQFQYVYRDSSANAVAYHSSANAVQTTKEEDGWTVLADVITVPDNAAIDHVRLALRTGADYALYTVQYEVCKPQFETGTKATDWSPAPEDAELAISELTAELSVQAGKISANATKIETVDTAAANAQSAANAAQGTANNAQNAAASNAANLTAVATRVTTAEGNISALDGKISSKVSVTDFNAYGEALDNRMSLIEQDADTIALAVTGKLDKDAAASGVNTGTNGGVKVTITKDRFDVDVPGEDGDFVLNESGAKVPVLTAERIEAPNVALRYNGPAALYVNPSATSAQVTAGNYYRSLTEACAAVSGRFLGKSVTITVQGDTYGDAALDGVYGSGSVTIQGSGNSLIGTLTLKDCGSRIYLYGLTVSQPSASTATRAVWIAGCQYVAMESSVSISGNGGTYALLIEYGSTAWLYGVALYNATYLMYCLYNTHVTTLNLKGGGGTYFAWANGCLLKMAGTRPDGTLRRANAALTVPDDPTALTIDYGSATPSVPAVSTATYNYLYSDSYRGGWSYFSDEDIRQGYDGKAIYGVIWFDAAAIKSALTGKTIKQVSLRLYMAKGVGRGVNVNVELYGSDVSYDRTAAPGLTTSYGSIGETQPDAVNEITIPATAVSDMVSGKTRALVLKSSDSELYKDRAYSRNYAKFAGSTSATADTKPRLTVVYQ